MIKKLIVGLLFCMILIAPSTSKAETGVISEQKIKLDEANIDLRGYNIKGENYFRLRDLASTMNGSNKQFNVSYDAYTNSIIIEKNKYYEGAETKNVALLQNSRASISNDSLIVEGEFKTVKTYKINNNNYMRLRDVAKIIDMGVEYKAQTNSVHLYSNSSYKEVEADKSLSNQASNSTEKLIKTHEELKGKIIEGMLNYTEVLDLKFQAYITMDEISKILDEITKSKDLIDNYDGCSYSVRSGASVSDIKITFKYNRDKNTDDKIDAEICRILQAVSYNDTDYNKVKFIHDYIINNTRYNFGDSNKLSNGYRVYSPEAILFGDGGVCQAYATLFQRMAKKLGLEVEYVTGTAWDSAEEGDHAWNMVKVDGDWYHIDVTWDDPLGVDQLNYDYFLKSDDHMRKDHAWESTTKAYKSY